MHNIHHLPQADCERLDKCQEIAREIGFPDVTVSDCDDADLPTPDLLNKYCLIRTV